jgi:hypothetical protein
VEASIENLREMTSGREDGGRHRGSFIPHAGEAADFFCLCSPSCPL